MFNMTSHTHTYIYISLYIYIIFYRYLIKHFLLHFVENST